MEKKNKRFKSEIEQILGLLFYSFLFIGGFYLSIDIVLQDDMELIEHWGKQKLIGSSGQRSAQVIEMFIINNFGKKGFFLFNLLMELFLIEECLLPALSTFRRFKQREREIREGLRAPDDYVDDYVRVPLWRKIANLFTQKRKKKYPSEREMCNSLKKNKYYKE